MLRKRSRSLQKEQHHMVNMTNSDSNSDHHPHQFLALGRNNTHQNHSIFNPPCLFVGLGPKGLLDADSVRSPTSPLDARVLSNLGNHVRTPRSTNSSSQSQSQSHSHPHEGNQRSWDCCKVGLSLIDSLEDCSKFSGKILRSSESKNICLSPKMMIKTPNFQTYMDDSFESSKSLPKDFCKAPCAQNRPGLFHKGESSVLFEIGDSGLDHETFGKTRSCSLDSCSPLKTLSGLTNSNTDPSSDDFALKDVSTIKLSSPPHFIGGSKNSITLTPVELSSNTVSIGSSGEFLKSISASEIELSEDYTCVISHGPNPKTTHIFGDCILETHSNDFIKNHLKNEEKDKGVSVINKRLHAPIHYPSSEFLSFCHHCNKKLEEGKDIYIYRGEKAFCTLTCRALEIMNDEELEESNNTPPLENSPKHEIGDQIFETGILTTT